MLPHQNISSFLSSSNSMTTQTLIASSKSQSGHHSNASNHITTTITTPTSSSEVNELIDCQSNSVVFNSKQKKYLFCILTTNFACYITYAIIAPFYTVVAQEKGLDQFRIDHVFSGYAFASVLVSPLLGRLTPWIGCKPMLLIGLTLNGMANVAFGFLDRIPDADLFFITSLALRSVEAVGTIAIVTANYTYVIRMFPHNVGYVFGLTETAVGLGLCLGPALGGPFFALGGYGLAFYVFGGLEFVCIFVCAFLLDNLKDSSGDDDQKTNVVSSSSSCAHSDFRDQPCESQPVTYLQLLTIPRVQFLCILIVLTSCCQNYTFPTLQKHLQSLGQSEVVGSLEFFLYSFFYMISTPLVGRMSDRIGTNFFFIIFLGHALDAIGFLLVGPASFATFLSSNLIYTSVGLAVMGFSIGVALIPSFDGILQSARQQGISDNLHTYGKVSGLWTCMFSLGEVIGPQLSGTLTEFYGFRTSSTLFAAMSACFLPLLLLLILIDRHKIHRTFQSVITDTITTTTGPDGNEDGRVLLEHDELLSV